MGKALMLRSMVTRVLTLAKSNKIDEARSLISQGQLIMRAPQMDGISFANLTMALDHLKVNNRSLWSSMVDTFQKTLPEVDFDTTCRLLRIFETRCSRDVDWKAVEMVLLGKFYRNMDRVCPINVVEVPYMFSKMAKGSPKFWEAAKTIVINTLEMHGMDFKGYALYLVKTCLAFDGVLDRHSPSDCEFSARLQSLVVRVLEQLWAKDYCRLVMLVGRMPGVGAEFKDRVHETLGQRLQDPDLQGIDLACLLYYINDTGDSRNEVLIPAIIKRLVQMKSKISAESLVRIYFEIVNFREFTPRALAFLDRIVQARVGCFKLSDFQGMRQPHPNELGFYLTFGEEGTQALVREISTDRAVLLELLLRFEGAAPAIAEKLFLKGIDHWSSIYEALLTSNTHSENGLVVEFSIILSKLEIGRLMKASEKYFQLLGLTFSKLLSKKLAPMITNINNKNPKASFDDVHLLYQVLQGQLSIHHYLNTIKRQLLTDERGMHEELSLVLLTFLSYSPIDQISVAFHQFVSSHLDRLIRLQRFDLVLVHLFTSPTSISLPTLPLSPLLPPALRWVYGWRTGTEVNCFEETGEEVQEMLEHIGQMLNDKHMSPSDKIHRMFVGSPRVSIAIDLDINEDLEEATLELEKGQNRGMQNGIFETKSNKSQPGNESDQEDVGKEQDKTQKRTGEQFGDDDLLRLLEESVHKEDLESPILVDDLKDADSQESLNTYGQTGSHKEPKRKKSVKSSDKTVSNSKVGKNKGISNNSTNLQVQDSLSNMDSPEDTIDNLDPSPKGGVYSSTEVSEKKKRGRPKKTMDASEESS